MSTTPSTSPSLELRVRFALSIPDLAITILSPTTTTASYRKYPYKALIRDLSSITSWPITPAHITEIYEVGYGRPNAPPPDAPDYDVEYWEAQLAFDEAHKEDVIYEREKVVAAMKSQRVQRKVSAATTGLLLLKTDSQRALEAEVAMDQALIRAKKMEAEAEGILDEALTEGITQMDVADGRKTELESDLSNEEEPPRKKLRRVRGYYTLRERSG
ncbi:MAG: hypothetical protein Q9172_007751 [Xanthocarpia lactea]